MTVHKVNPHARDDKIQRRNEQIRKATEGSASSVAQIKIGTYEGDGQATQTITGVGLDLTGDHCFALAYEQGTGHVNIRTSADESGKSKDFADGSYDTDEIMELLSDGFTVGNGVNINDNGVTYTYICGRGVQ